jgi:hypothetical protein
MGQHPSIADTPGTPEPHNHAVLALQQVTDVAIALEDRESKLLPLSADVHAPALVAI